MGYESRGDEGNLSSPQFCPLCQRWHGGNERICEDCWEVSDVVSHMARKRYGKRLVNGFKLLNVNE